MVRNERPESPSASGSREYPTRYNSNNGHTHKDDSRDDHDGGRRNYQFSARRDQYKRGGASGGERRDHDRDRDREYRGRQGDRDRGYDRERDKNRDSQREREGERGEREREREREREGGERERDRGYPSRGARRSASPPLARSSRHHSRRNSRSPLPYQRSSRPRSRSRTESEDNDESSKKKEKEEQDKLKPNYNNSGLLAAATKTVQTADGKSTVLKYHEPPEARKPVLGWRLYVFKGSEQVDLLHIHRQSAYLIGRDRAVADISIDHPSCSKQHAVIQHRSVQEKDEFGAVKTKIKPFIIDLESTNGTHVNDKTIPTSRYYEVMQSDVIKFGDSTREYVLLHDEAS